MIPAFAGAQTTSGRLGLGLNYPGLGAKLFLNPRAALEARAQYDKDSERRVSLVGLRAYYYFHQQARFPLFAGAESDFISYKTRFTRGHGMAASVFVGGEYFFAKRLALQIDFGPAYIALGSNTSTANVSGVDYVVNFGIYYYFGSYRNVE